MFSVAACSDGVFALVCKNGKKRRVIRGAILAAIACAVPVSITGLIRLLATANLFS
ncbi:MAG: hypothetical protein K2W95_19605 [Candidatus Obscuribacterales bacterium]|nr:hypothetical protein [Candidatus Obscuribacterales bacterium]